jgi:hypothetical protein
VKSKKLNETCRVRIRSTFGQRFTHHRNPKTNGFLLQLTPLWHTFVQTLYYVKRTLPNPVGVNNNKARSIPNPVSCRSRSNTDDQIRPPVEDSWQSLVGGCERLIYDC